MPSGSGRKGGAPKRKKRVTIPVETRSVRPCFDADTVNDPSTSSSIPECNAFQSPSPSIVKENTSGVAVTPLVPRTEVSSHQAARPVSITPGYPSVSSSISSGFGIVAGGSVNITSPTHSFSPVTPTQFSSPFLNRGSGENTNPFVLKFKTNQIKICQSCRKNYEDSNDTMGLVVARAERRMVSNLATVDPH